MRSGFLSCVLPSFGGRAPCCRFGIANLRRCVCDTKNKRLFFPCRMYSGLVWM
nr:MAG TPA: hypothetical protein [Caudoviricetes sp.]